MSISLTKFIYPIKNKIVLSQKLQIALDNPRSEAEINLIKEFVKPAIELWDSMGPAEKSVLTWLFEDFMVLREYVKNKDEYAYNFFNENENSLDIICKSWIIIRYEDGGFLEKYLSNKQERLEYFSEERKFIENAYLELKNYCFLISLLAHNETSYSGESFLLWEDAHEFLYEETKKYGVIVILQDITMFCSTLNDDNYKPWNFFPNVCKPLLLICSRLDALLDIKTDNLKKQSTKEKILFIGNLLRITSETKDYKIKLLLLVSIIEFILTHNPDHNRFNIEDSISKQFILKAAILIYLNNKFIDLNQIKSDLKLIYKQRSDIAHGNYISSNKDENVLKSVWLLYEYSKAIIEEYIQDSKFVEYLKAN